MANSIWTNLYYIWLKIEKKFKFVKFRINFFIWDEYVKLGYLH